MPIVDLGPTATRLVHLVEVLPDDLLPGPTPCPAYTRGDLVDHVGGFALAFAMAATKTAGDGGSRGPSGDASRLGDDWRTRIRELPGEAAGMFALDELVIHGWDVARASGQPYDCDGESLAALHRFVAPFAEPNQAPARAGLFGPVVGVAEDAPLLDRIVGLTGRDPGWSPR